MPKPRPDRVIRRLGAGWGLIEAVDRWRARHDTLAERFGFIQYRKLF
jgi:hypothetical protein